MEKMTLAGKTYTVLGSSESGYDLKGPRGASYCLIKNLHSSMMWCLIPAGSPKRTTWFKKVGETFEPY